MILGEQRAREHLAAELGRPVHDAIWSQLLELEFVQDYMLTGSVGGLVKKYRDFETMACEMRGTAHERRSERKIPPDERLTAISNIAAFAAEQAPGVTSFRQQALGAKLLALEQVTPWVEDQYKRQGAPTNYLKIAVPSGTTLNLTKGDGPEFPLGAWPQPAIPISQRSPAALVSRDYLAWGDVEDGTVHHIPVSVSSTLGQLHRLSVALSKEFPWSEEHATLFVLTGVPPRIAHARIQTHEQFGAFPYRRLRLDLDPTLSPQKVAALYAQERKKLLPKRYRPMSLKHLHLAEFTVRVSEGTWQQRMREWNRKSQSEPGWGYDNPRTFARDSKAALNRLFE